MPIPDDFDYSGDRRAVQTLRPVRASMAPAASATSSTATACSAPWSRSWSTSITDDPAGLLLADRRIDIQLEITRAHARGGQGRHGLLWMGEDLGTQRGPTISMEIFRKHIRPRYQKFCDLARPTACRS